MLLVVLCLAVHWNILRRLKKRHRETWTQLGSPTLFWNNAITNSRLTWKFVEWLILK